MPLNRYFARRYITWLAPLAMCLAATPAAQASSLLALDKGCYSCHGSPQQKGAPTMDKLAEDYAQYRGQTDAATRLASQLREHHVFGSIMAHERLTEESALTLVRWLIDGAK